MFREWWHNLTQQDFGGTFAHIHPHLHVSIRYLLSFAETEMVWHFHGCICGNYVYTRYAALLHVNSCALFLGGILRKDSESAMCVKQSYSCDGGDTATFTVKIPADITTESYMYLGLGDFSSAYINIRTSFSNIQMQGVPRSKDYLPYDACEPIHTLSDVQGADNVFIPIDEFATDKDWRSWLDPDTAKTMTLRPCGGLFYWIPTDSFSLIDPSGKSVFMDSVGELSWDELDIPREPANTVFPYIDPVTEELVWADPSTQRMRAWMRSNIHSNFILKAGTIPGPLKTGTYTVNVVSCRDLETPKYVKICTTTWLGYDQDVLSTILLVLGCILMLSLVGYFVVPVGFFMQTSSSNGGGSSQRTLFN